MGAHVLCATQTNNSLVRHELHCGDSAQLLKQLETELQVFTQLAKSEHGMAEYTPEA